MPEMQFILKLIGALAVAGVISYFATPLVKSLAYKVGAIDVPKDNRRMHKTPIPRLGGLAIKSTFFINFLPIYHILLSNLEYELLISKSYP